MKKCDLPLRYKEEKFDVGRKINRRIIVNLLEKLHNPLSLGEKYILEHKS